MQDNHKPNHKCLACGKEYYACDSCDKKINKTWRAACCAEGHYQAYYAMWQYAHGQLDRSAAREILAAQDALSWEKAPGRALIEEIMNTGEEAGAEGEPEKEVSEEPEGEQVEPEKTPAVSAGKKKRRR